MPEQQELVAASAHFLECCGSDRKLRETAVVGDVEVYPGDERHDIFFIAPGCWDWRLGKVSGVGSCVL